jgi:uncharacterized phiE125 gp8 family phage protein
MYQQITNPRATPLVTPEQLASFGRFDIPQNSPMTADYQMLQLFIEAATDQVEQLAATATVTEQILETYDFFPGQADPRNMLNYQLGYGYNWAPWWWYGFPTKDSIELVRRPVITSTSPVVGVTITYFDSNGALQTFDPSNYTVAQDKVCLNVGSTWPLTDRRQDCIQISYSAGYGTDPTSVPAQLQLAVMYLATNFYENRNITTVEPTSEVYMTLMSLLASYRSYRIPR